MRRWVQAPASARGDAPVAHGRPVKEVGAMLPYIIGIVAVIALLVVWGMRRERHAGPATRDVRENATQQRDPSLHRGSTILPEQPSGPGHHF